MQYHLSFDPSIHSLGWALYTARDGPINKDHLNDFWNWQFGTFKTKSNTYEWQLTEIREFCRSIKVEPQSLVIEMPGFYNTETGRIAAKQGYTIGLGMVAGTIIGALKVSAPKIFFYTAPQWKGAVPKDVTYKKLVRTFADSYARQDVNLSKQHDTVDAIMLLHYHLTWHADLSQKLTGC